MKPIRIYHHQNRQRLSYLETWLQQQRVPFEVQCLDHQHPVMMDMDGLAGMVFMGGAGNVNQPTDYMEQELILIRNAAAVGMPMMGVCLGAQLISKALGGAVCQNSSLEVGWRPIVKTETQPGSHWFADLPERFEVFQWHAHIYEMPVGARVLAGNHCFSQQAYVLRNILSMQFHLEMTADMIEHLVETYPEDIATPSPCVQSAGQIRDRLPQRVAQLHALADEVYADWLQCVYRHE